MSLATVLKQYQNNLFIPKETGIISIRLLPPSKAKNKHLNAWLKTVFKLPFATKEVKSCKQWIDFPADDRSKQEQFNAEFVSRLMTAYTKSVTTILTK